MEGCAIVVNDKNEITYVLAGFWTMRFRTQDWLYGATNSGPIYEKDEINRILGKLTLECIIIQDKQVMYVKKGVEMPENTGPFKVIYI